MYIGIDGKIIKEKIMQIKDTVDFNFSIDSMDLPLSRFGVPQKMSFSTKQDLFESLSLLFSDLQTQDYLNGVNLDRILIDSNNLDSVTLELSYNNQSIAVGVNI